MVVINDSRCLGGPERELRSQEGVPRQCDEHVKLADGGAAAVQTGMRETTAQANSGGGARDEREDCQRGKPVQRAIPAGVPRRSYSRARIRETDGSAAICRIRRGTSITSTPRATLAERRGRFPSCRANCASD